MASHPSLQKLSLIEKTGVIVIALYAVWSVFRIVTSFAPDFSSYYGAVTSAVLSVYTTPNLLPPMSRIVFWPIGLLPYTISQALWTLVSISCLWVSVRLTLHILKNYSYRDAAIYSAMAFVSFPTRFTLGMGQVNLIALAMLIAAVYEESRERSLIGGTLWTVAVLLKPELVLLSIVFVLMKRWKFCLASVGSMLLSIAVSLAIWGVDAYTVYGSRMSSELALLAGRAVYYNQSLSGVIARFGVYEWSEPAYVGITIAFIVCFLWLARSKKMVFPTLMWVAIPVFLIIEPIAWQHHLVYLLPTYLWIWDKVTLTVAFPGLNFGLGAHRD